jgi:hypothetical protein
MRTAGTAIQRADVIDDETGTVAAVDSMPTSPDFKISRPGDGVMPHTGSSDSAEASRFKSAIKDLRRLVIAGKGAGLSPVKSKLDFAGISNAAIEGVNPEINIQKRTLDGIHLPDRFKNTVVENFKEPVAYPVFDIPMYRPLNELSSELFVPNLNFVAENSVTLLETNQPFIEAYMVGLNHEFARELLWREYFTDQRGSYFRQFWDVSAYFDANNLNDETLKEKLRDIPPLHLWSRFSNLGDHDHRAATASPGEQALVVLVIRGEILKRYPNAVIYAHRARWQQKQSGAIDNTKERQLETLTAAEEQSPPRTKVRTPLYDAKVEPDVYFFGFDLTAAQAMGGTGTKAGDDPGWFFVIKERPGELRFGLDVEKSKEIHTWNDLSWEDIPGTAPGNFIKIDAATPTLNVVAPIASEDQEETEQYQDDHHVSFDKNMSSADLAYILYQAPVLVAIHAAELLRQL